MHTTTSDDPAHASERRRAAIVSIDRTIRSLETMRALLLTQEQASDQWRSSGHASFEAWRGQTSGIGVREARREAAVATTVAREPAIRAALQQDAVTMQHAAVITAAERRAARTGANPLDDGERTQLLAVAKQHDAEEFARITARWMATRDATAHDRDHDRIRARRFLSIAETPRGTHIKGFLDPVAGHTLKLALEAATPKPAPDDARDHPQRAADALVTIAEHALASGSLKGGALVRPHVSFIMSEQSFLESRRELSRRSGAPAEGTVDPTVTASSPAPSTPATLEDGTPLPLSETARLLCDAEITRVVVDADDVPVNLGRTVRLYSREQRRAVVARDRTCRFDGCQQPARWCQVHHIDWWERDGGETSIDNAILLCSFHHHEVHRQTLSVSRIPGAPPEVRLNQPPASERSDPSRPRNAGPPHRQRPRTTPPPSGPRRQSPARPSSDREPHRPALSNAPPVQGQLLVPAH